MTSAAPIRVPARATSPPNALLRANEGARPMAAPDAAAPEVFAGEVAAVDVLIEADVPLEVVVEVVVEEFPESVAHSDF